jgi:hypothetical protein
VLSDKRRERERRREVTREQTCIDAGQRRSEEQHNIRKHATVNNQYKIHVSAQNEDHKKEREETAHDRRHRNHKNEEQNWLRKRKEQYEHNKQDIMSTENSTRQTTGHTKEQSDTRSRADTA